MDDQPRALLEELHRHGVAHDEDRPNRLDRLHNLEPESAQLLAVVVRAMGARSLLELGTSIGYPTVWLADPVRATGWRWTTSSRTPSRSPTSAPSSGTPGADVPAVRQRGWRWRMADVQSVSRKPAPGVRYVVRSQMESWRELAP